MCVLTICHVKLTQSTAMAQKQSLLPALRNLWLLLVIYCNEYFLQHELLVVSLASPVNLDLMLNSPSISKQAQGDLRGESVY